MFRFSALLCCLAILVSAVQGETKTVVLSDHHSDIQVNSASPERPWTVTKNILHGGKQEGSELITLDNGEITIRVIPTRGMSILDITKGDFRLGWESPVKEVVHPSLIDLESRGGLGWLEGFNEWMVRCGLESAGHPGLDEFVDNTGAKAEMNLTLHGKIGNIPASKVELIIDQEEPYSIRLRGSVHERLFFGPKLELVTELMTIPGSDVITITDTVINHGAQDQEFQLIYHTNYGAPLLESGAKVYTAAESITPMNENAAKAISTYQTYLAPTVGFTEEVFLVSPKADKNDQCRVCLTNAKGDRAASIVWSVKELPYLTIWKNTAAKEDGYVTGLEPATGYPFNRKVERAAGRVPKLKPGEERSFTLEYHIHSDADAVQKELGKIQSIQGNTPAELVKEPPATE